MKDPYLVKAAIPVTEVLEKLDVAYYISGSVASSAYGMSRSTMDVDCVSNLSRNKVALFVEMLKKDYYVDEDAIREAIDRKASFNLIHLETMFKVDVFIASEKPYDQKALERRKKDSLDVDLETKIYLATPEDVIISKLKWFQDGGQVSERQWNDILGVIKVQKEQLDLQYLNLWTVELNLTELFNKALSESKI